MRKIFIKTLSQLAAKNKNILLLTGDLGYSVLEDFQQKFPQQFLNVGISEQNMTGVAAGMAMEGKIPVIYSIIPFCTMRNFEQIRNDICYQNLNVKIVGVGTGFSYGPYGYTHHPLEDIAIMRALPNITIFSPADEIETEFVVKEAFKLNSPVYIRLGRAQKSIHSPNDKLNIANFSKIKNGKDIVILSTGNITESALNIANDLDKKSFSTCVISVHTLKPFDIKSLQMLITNFQAIFTLEEHSIIGGLGSIVAEVIAEYRKKIIYKRFGTPDKITHFVGNLEFMRSKHGLSENEILRNILKTLS